MNKVFELVSKEDILNSIDYPKDSIVFLSGSIVNGLGNTKSDIDVFIVYNKSTDIDKYKIDINTEANKVKFEVINKVGIDIEYWNINELEILIDKLKNMEIKKEENLSNQFPIDKLSLIHRFITGVAIYNEEKFELLQQSLNISNFMKFNIYVCLNDIENIYEDIIGNYEVDRMKTAYLMCNNCIIKVLMAYLFYKSVSLDRTKWVHLLLERLSETDEEAKNILEKADEFLIQNKYSYDLKLGVEKAIEFINETIELIQEF